MFNRLIHETSPYLQQHAHNPVDWYPWGDEALQRAKKENKPILVSIGYAACHWCHVMERESFEDPAVAAIMNEQFVNIKIDREERPDLDHIYMDAVQVMTGSGGWPLNVFLTPDAKPFYGGTYFPPTKAFNRASWTDVLQGVASAFAERREEVTAQAEGLTAHLLQTNKVGEPVGDESQVFTKQNADLIFDNLMKAADKTAGGFGRAPKFPQTFSIQYLLRYFHFYKNEAALAQACLSLDKMLYGGIYDQAGGGFARYATDNDWLVPHFEKMLYDNALLLSTLSEAYQVTHHTRYAKTIAATIAFVERELMSAEDGFYAALDADSEGEEGKFYVWSRAEVQELLGPTADLFCRYYDITNEGNWEGNNILHVPVPPDRFAVQEGITQEELETMLEDGRKKLLARRSNRPRPLLDDKMLLGWNALMNSACSKAFAATGEEHYRQLAIRNMRCIFNSLRVDGIFYHSYKSGIARQPAFLDDLAYLVKALIDLQEITGDASYLEQAEEITEEIISKYADRESPFFFFTHEGQQDVIIRKKEIYDSAVPSGNSVMAGNLLYLSRVLDKKEWERQSIAMIGTLLGLTTRYPTSFGGWANLLIILTNGYSEIVVTGKNFNEVIFDILHIFNPAGVLQSSSVPNEKFPLLQGKEYLETYLIYLCQNYACKPPVNSFALFMQQLEGHSFVK
ncbi:MAG TPA: thioredoxin domain-containing protein [Chitinophagaceae bacterium]|nr:thioredoxin domain-containing protein [Chitinophagaceae bacterium]